MVSLIIGLVLLASFAAALPIVGERCSESRVLVILASFTPLATIGLIAGHLIGKGLDIVYPESGLFLILFVFIVTVVVALTAEGLVRTLYERTYNAGYKSAEEEYRRAIDDLTTENATICQLLADNGIQTPTPRPDWREAEGDYSGITGCC